MVVLAITKSEQASLPGCAENDIEGRVERRCRSCIDGGVPAAPPQEEPKPAAEEAKK